MRSIDSTAFLPERPRLRDWLILGLALLPQAAIADPLVLDDGAVSHELSVGSEKWSGRDDALYLEPRFRMGLAAGYEIGLNAHMRRENEGEGLRYLGWSAAFPLGDEGNRALGLYGTVAQVDEGETAIGSGNHGYGLELRMTDEVAEDGRIGGQIGIGRSDVPAGVGEPGYSSETRFYYDAHYEHYLASGFALGLESRVAIGLSGEEMQNRFGMALRPGVRFDAGERTALRASMGRDLPKRGIEPENTMMLSVEHRPAPPVPRSELASRLQAVEARNRSLKAEQVAQGARQEEQGRRLEAVRHKAGTLTVEVINASGIPGLGETMAERLLHKGHHVVAIREPANPEERDVTYIRYRAGLADEAVELGHSIRQIQIVTQEHELEGEAEVRVLVGRDQADFEWGDQ
ncbi:MAG: LytR C-terminal domain-containing protein [Pseudomonadota bacterium]